MVLAFVALIIGLLLLVWSADRFVNGASQVARHFQMSPLLIGMIIVGFGTSTPEMIVSAAAAIDGNGAMALGNALGSNITNIALILGIVAVLSPIAVQSQVLRKELPILAGFTLWQGWQLYDGVVSRAESSALLFAFLAYVGWTIYESRQSPKDQLAKDVVHAFEGEPSSKGKAWLGALSGLILLVISSRLLVWGAATIASHLGVSDLIVGLTIVGVGTSLPELTASVIAVRKGEHDLALGNVMGSNLFNTLAVVGTAGLIQPLVLDVIVFWRDYLTMLALTLALFITGYGFRKREGRINRSEGAFFLVCYVAYCWWLISGSMM